METKQIGMWSGILATTVMALTLSELQKLNGSSKSETPSTTLISGGLKSKNLTDFLSNDRKVELSLGAQFAYGAALGTLYSEFQASRKDDVSVRDGILFGLAVWVGNYVGFLPAIDSRASTFNSKAATNKQMFLGHIVWGACLGLAERWLHHHGDEMLAAT